MGVDYYACKSCGDIVCDCSDRIYWCGECKKVICEDCLAEEPEYNDETGELLGKCCPYCSGKDVHNDDLLYFLLRCICMTREEAVERYRKEKESE